MCQNAFVFSTYPMDRVTRRVMTWATVALLVLTLGCTGAAAAGPYPVVVSTTPANGATIDVAPSEVAVTFSKDIGPDVFFLTVDGPGILQHPSGSVTRSGRTMSRPFVTSPVSSPQAPADRYEVRYKAVLTGGDPISGSFSFLSRRPGPASWDPSTSAGPGLRLSQASSDEADTSSERLPWVVASVATSVLAVAVAAYLLVARRRNR